LTRARGPHQFTASPPRHRDLFAGHRVRAASPQGRFTEGAALIDRRVLTDVTAHGKHLLHWYGEQSPCTSTSASTAR
jgi:endonuclease-8